MHRLTLLMHASAHRVIMQCETLEKRFNDCHAVLNPTLNTDNTSYEAHFLKDMLRLKHQ